MDQEEIEIRLAPEYLDDMNATHTNIVMDESLDDSLEESLQESDEVEPMQVEEEPPTQDEVQNEGEEPPTQDEVQNEGDEPPTQDEVQNEGDEPPTQDEVQNEGEEEPVETDVEPEPEEELGLPENVFLGVKTPLNLQLFALCRSGNHAIIEWMLRNVCHHAIENVRGVTGLYVQQSKKDGVYFRNNVNHTVPDQKRWKPPRQYNLMIESHEDTPIRSIRSGYTPFAIIREFGNLLASRYQKFWAEDSKRLAHWSREPHNRTYLIRIKELIVAWKNHARSIQQKKVIGVLYDRWVVDLPYRNSVMEMFGLHNWADDRSNVSECGDGSSFIGMELEHDHSRYLNRWEQVEFPVELKRAVLADKELVALNKDLFGMDLEQEMK